ncbi:hypothetical protein SAMN05216304_103478 [Bosea sp. OK403]|nr:hypothetical protein SAMN05216304_103478 [Bosea sp. OK403]
MDVVKSGSGGDEAHRASEGSIQPPDKALDHAWRYFALHAQQRISVFNYFIAFSGIMAAGIGATIKTMPSAAAVIALILAALSFVFYKLDARASELVKISEKALIDGERLSMPPYAQVVATEAGGRATNLQSDSSATWTFGQCFRFIFGLVGMTATVGGLFSVYLALK